MRQLARLLQNVVAGNLPRPVGEPRAQLGNSIRTQAVRRKLMVGQLIQSACGVREVRDPEARVAAESQGDHRRASESSKCRSNVHVIAWQAPPDERGSLRADGVLNMKHGTQRHDDWWVLTPIPREVEQGDAVGFRDLKSNKLVALLYEHHLEAGLRQG